MSEVKINTADGEQWSRMYAMALKREQVILAQCNRLREALERYADPINWGYYDESGCAKGEGKYEDACFIGPAIAREALEQGGQDET